MGLSQYGQVEVTDRSGHIEAMAAITVGTIVIVTKDHHHIIIEVAAVIVYEMIVLLPFKHQVMGQMLKVV